MKCLVVMVVCLIGLTALCQPVMSDPILPPPYIATPTVLFDGPQPYKSYLPALAHVVPLAVDIQWDSVVGTIWRSDNLSREHTVSVLIAPTIPTLCQTPLARQYLARAELYTESAWMQSESMPTYDATSGLCLFVMSDETTIGFSGYVTVGQDVKFGAFRITDKLATK